MLSADQLRKGWAQRARLFPIEPAMTFAEAGVVLGAGTVLAPRYSPHRGQAAFAIDGCEERILALLAVAHGRAVAPETIGHIRRACRHYANAEACLTLIQLAYAGHPDRMIRSKSHTGCFWPTRCSPTVSRHTIC